MMKEKTSETSGFKVTLNNVENVVIQDLRTEKVLTLYPDEALELNKILTEFLTSSQPTPPL